MEKKLYDFDNYDECIICFDNIETKYKTTCKLCGIMSHNRCWKDWTSSSGKNNRCVHCGQQNCIETKQEAWYIRLFYCFFPFLNKKNKSI